MLLIIYCLSILLVQLTDADECECGKDSLIKYDANGLPKTLPWAVRIKLTKGPYSFYDTYCDGVILSSTQIATWNCDIIGSRADEKVSIFTGRKLVSRYLFMDLPEFPARVIKRPKWRKLGGYHILVLNKPLSRKAPICIAKSNHDTKADILLYQFDDVHHQVNHIYYLAELKYDKVYSIVHKLIIGKRMIGKSAAIFKKDGKWYFAGVSSRENLILDTSKLAQNITGC